MNKICLYSKYSPNSKKLLDIMKKNLNDISYICVDNDFVRNRIKNNKNIIVNYVPCILIINQNGIVEKYEGEHAFSWGKSLLPTKSKPSSSSSLFVPARHLGNMLSQIVWKQDHPSRRP